MARSLNQCPSLSIERIPAIYGPDLPDAAVLMLTGHRSSVRHRGSLGCFLSHAKSWEAIAAGGEALALVMEDDAVLLGIERIAELRIPAGADLVFVNDRMSPGSRHARPVVPVTCLPMVESLRALYRSGFGVGGDGYIMTKRGATAALEAVAKDRFFGHIDWRLLRYSLTPADLAGEFEGTRVADIILNHHHKARPPAWGILNAYCLNSPLVAFATGGTSTRALADGQA